MNSPNQTTFQRLQLRMPITWLPYTEIVRRNKLKLQIAFLTASTFVVGVGFGIYLAAVYIGGRCAELSR